MAWLSLILCCKCSLFSRQWQLSNAESFTVAAIQRSAVQVQASAKTVPNGLWTVRCPLPDIQMEEVSALFVYPKWFVKPHEMVLTRQKSIMTSKLSSHCFVYHETDIFVAKCATHLPLASNGFTKRGAVIHNENPRPGERGSQPESQSHFLTKATF